MPQTGFNPRESSLLRRSGLFFSLTFTLLVLVNCAGTFAAQLVGPNHLGLRVESGFEVTAYADANLADDIQALTIDPRGNVVVTGPGYIRTLVDEDDDGVADRAIEYARTTTGGMGLCFDGTDLLFVGDGGLWRFRDVDQNGQADGAPDKMLALNSGEHGGHAVRKGPDGAIYVMAGNDAGLAAFPAPTGPKGSNPVEGGALLRLLPTLQQGFQVVAYGFRNAYDFDFNFAGDIFTYDSDAEADFLLPWYTPSRLYHIAPGGHHGWRLDGWKRSWNRPEYSPDTVGILENMGRGSPSGVVCYRHLQFPPDYREGLFVLDWSFGRVYFVALQMIGSSYNAAPEIFLEASGASGFAPTDVAVGLDGALYISTGGRKARGGVYRVDYVAEPSRSILATNWMLVSATEVQAVFIAPQPLEQWSRESWVPMAERLGPEPFSLLARDNRGEPDRRTRAIEILTTVHEGLSPAEATICAQADPAIVRARTAWSLGVLPSENAVAVLTTLTRDLSPAVRLAALNALRERVGDLTPATIQQALSLNLAHPDKRVRQAAALLATWLPDAAWNALLNTRGALPPQSRLTLAMASLWRSPPKAVDTATAEMALSALTQARDSDLQLQAVRLLIASLGDYNLQKPSAEVFTGFEPAFVPVDPALPLRIEKAVAPLFPSASADLNVEVTTLLAMIQAREATLPQRLLTAITPQSRADMDFQYLAALARLGEGALPTNLVSRIAGALVGFDRKLNGASSRPKQNWSARLNEVAQRLLAKNPSLADAILQQKDFPRAGNLALVEILPPEKRSPASRLFFNAVQQTPAFPWTPELVELLALMPDDQVHPLFRKQWSNPALRDRIVVELAHKPLGEDREKFLAGLGSGDPRAASSSAAALLKLARDASPTAMAQALKWLRRLTISPSEPAARAEAVALVSHFAGQKFAVREQGQDLAAAYQHVFDAVSLRYPGLLSQVDAAMEGNPVQWAQFYKTIRWDQGNPNEGELIFNQRGCINCHAGPSAVGPDLSGAARRLSTAELFNAIVLPSREIAAPYRTSVFRLRNGQVYSGIVTYESGEVVIVQTGMSSTVRLNASDIASREFSTVSFMPAGLMGNLAPAAFADLYSYLRTLNPSR